MQRSRNQTARLVRIRPLADCGMSSCSIVEKRSQPAALKQCASLPSQQHNPRGAHAAAASAAALHRAGSSTASPSACVQLLRLLTA